jgi:hypothetical protein
VGNTKETSRGKGRWYVDRKVRTERIKVEKKDRRIYRRKCFCERE